VPALPLFLLSQESTGGRQVRAVTLGRCGRDAAQLKH